MDFKEYFEKTGNLEPEMDTDFVLRKCMIIDNGTFDDPRVQVRPDIEGFDMDESSLENCPRFPAFANDCNVTGKSYNDYGTKADHVWVITNFDYSVGYVLCLAQGASPTSLTEKHRQTFNLDGLSQLLTKGEIKPDKYEYKYFSILKWFSTSEGGLIVMHHNLTGDFFIINSTGTILSVCHNGIYMRVGGMDDSGQKQAFSEMKMTLDAVKISSPLFDVSDCEKVKLGKTGQKALGTISSTPIISAITGTSASPDDRVTL